jgi:hypothetical protein
MAMGWAIPTKMILDTGYLILDKVTKRILTSSIQYQASSIESAADGICPKGAKFF